MKNYVLEKVEVSNGFVYISVLMESTNKEEVVARLKEESERLHNEYLPGEVEDSENAAYGVHNNMEGNGECVRLQVEDEILARIMKCVDESFERQEYKTIDVDSTTSVMCPVYNFPVHYNISTKEGKEMYPVSIIARPYEVGTDETVYDVTFDTNDDCKYCESLECITTDALCVINAIMFDF